MLIPKNKGNIKKLHELARSGDVDLWAIDEVRFQLHGSRCRMWIPAEIKDPVERRAARGEQEESKSMLLQWVGSATVEFIHLSFPLISIDT
jgi:hypothetical protein